MSFDSLGLSIELLRAIAEQGYTEATPIQSQGIPPVLEGRDVMAQAQTGTGKTAAFMLPILQRLQPGANTSPSPARHPLRALVLVPTRELAHQVYDSARGYGQHIPLRTAVVYGGVDMQPQIRELHAGVEILVATPGRLLDHAHSRTVNLSRIEILVLDEADRMLDMGFMPDIKRILALLPAQRQNLMFSATFSEDIRRLAGQILQDPVKIEVARRNAPAELVTHTVHLVEERRKRAALAQLVRAKDLRQVLVFVATKQGAGRLARELLRDGIEANAIHGDKTQPERQKALNEFKEGKCRVLVATDVAARGLDIEDLPHVVNFELPNTPEDYVHRIGRTGRAGRPGDAISLVADDEKEQLREIEKLLKFKLNVEPLPGGPVAERAERAERAEEPRRERGGKAREHAPPRRRERGGKALDPFFTQPYEPAAPAEAGPAAPAARPRQRHKREVPALFVLPPRARHK